MTISIEHDDGRPAADRCVGPSRHLLLLPWPSRHGGADLRQLAGGGAMAYAVAPLAARCAGLRRAGMRALGPANAVTLSRASWSAA